MEEPESESGRTNNYGSRCGRPKIIGITRIRIWTRNTGTSVVYPDPHVSLILVGWIRIRVQCCMFLLGAEWFSCSLDVLRGGGLGINKVQFFKIHNKFYNFWSSKPWIRIRIIDPKCWIWIPMRIHNTLPGTEMSPVCRCGRTTSLPWTPSSSLLTAATGPDSERARYGRSRVLFVPHPLPYQFSAPDPLPVLVPVPYHFSVSDPVP